MKKLPVTLVTAAVVFALGGCVSEGPVLSTGTNSPTADESMPAPGSRSATSGRPVPSPGSDANYREPVDGVSSAGSSRGSDTRSPTADESKQAPGSWSNSTGTVERIQ